MKKYHIELTDQEQALVDQIDLRLPHTMLLGIDGHEVYKANIEPIIKLIKSLQERGGVPGHRLRYWDDPEYNTSGRGRKSHLDIFKENGRTDNLDEIYTHPSFIEFLRYFLFGCELSNRVIETFDALVQDKHLTPKYFTSGDYDPMWKITRKVTRQYGLHKDHTLDASEEFLKLCLDMGFDIGVAMSVRNTVKKVR